MLFSPRLIALSNGTARSLDGASAKGQRLLVIPRAQCSFRSIMLKGKGRSALQAAYLRAGKEALPRENKIRIVKNRHGSNAGVWCYVAPSDYTGRTLPESLAREGCKEGVRLVQCLDGVEGQVWNEGFLSASRWWPKEPGQRQWQAFMRVAFLGEGDELPPQPAVITVPFRRNLPVLAFDRDRLAHLASPMNVVVGGALVFAVINFYQGAQYARHTVRTAQLDDKIAALSQSSALILSDRRKALANMAAARQFDVLGDKNGIMYGLDGLAHVVAQYDVVIRSANLQSGNLEILLFGQPDISGPSLVASLESIAVLSDVSVTLNARNVLVIRAKLQQDIKAYQIAGQP